MSVYIHNPDFVWPAVDNTHVVIAEPVHSFVYDAEFDYRFRKTFLHRLQRRLTQVVMFGIALPVCRIRYALRIRGRENVRKYREMTKQKGKITVCNHTTEWDTLFVLRALGRTAEFPIWQEGAESSSGTMYRCAGGLPMPKHDPRGMVYAFRAMKEVVREGKWLHVFPEAACWPFYPAVRNFEPGVFRIAVEEGLPVLPMGVRYRPATGLYRWFKKHPLAEISVGEPLVPDPSLPKKEAVEDLRRRCMLSVMHLIGIGDEEENAGIRAGLKTRDSGQ